MTITGLTDAASGFLARSELPSPASHSKNEAAASSVCQATEALDSETGEA